MQQADGILYTEKIAQTNEMNDIEYPTVLIAEHIRSAHIYNGAFSHVKMNFAIAGLKSVTQVSIGSDKLI